MFSNRPKSRLLKAGFVINTRFFKYNSVKFALLGGTKMLEFLCKYVVGAALPVLLVSVGVFFLFYLRFCIFRRRKTKQKNGTKGVSPLSALSVALAGTLGVGNITGVAGALLLGGLGSVFWMWVCALAAMVLKFAEILLGIRHRRRDGEGFFGGAQYYMEDYFKERGRPRLAATVPAIFSLLCALTALSMGSMLQTNAAGNAFHEISGLPAIAVGAIIAVLAGAVILRGKRDISPLTRVIIPAMTILYTVMCLAVIWLGRGQLGSVFSEIFRGAFSLRSGSAGVAGFTFASAVRYGALRGLISNEAGCGTAPMAHATADAESPFDQGLLGAAEVFIDTVLLCTLTALSVGIVFPADALARFDGSEAALINSAFCAVLGRGAGVALSVALFFFAFATVICWGFYGGESLNYITKSRTVHRWFKALYIICTFVGGFNVGTLVWQISDLALGTMAIINLTVLFLMRREIKAEGKSESGRPMVAPTKRE